MSYICCNILTSCCSEWTTDGCERVEVNESVVTCNCSHLTNFAILVVRIHFLIECAQLWWFGNIQWSLSNMDTLGTKTIVLISEVSLFQGENNNMYLYKVWTQSHVVINHASGLISRVPFKRGSTVQYKSYISFLLILIVGCSLYA